MWTFCHTWCATDSPSDNIHQNQLIFISNWYSCSPTIRGFSNMIDWGETYSVGYWPLDWFRSNSMWQWMHIIITDVDYNRRNISCKILLRSWRLVDIMTPHLPIFIPCSTCSIVGRFKICKREIWMIKMSFELVEAHNHNQLSAFRAQQQQESRDGGRLGWWRGAFSSNVVISSINGWNRVNATLAA